MLIQGYNMERFPVGVQLYSNANFYSGYEERIAYFPGMEDVRHGISWGKNTKNMAYKCAVGIDQVNVTRRLHKFHADIGLVPLTQAILLECAQARKVSFLDESPIPDDACPTDKGNFTESNAVLTTRNDVCIHLRTGDCTGTIVVGRNRDKRQFIGLIHASRANIDQEIPTAMITEICEHYGCDPNTLNLGIIPCLGPDSHVIRVEDSSRLINESGWNGFMQVKGSELYLDLPARLISQYTTLGVLPRKIELYDIDTFKASEEGELFSHRYFLNHRVRNGRFLTAVQLN
jgi:copper oxidase (laccase) domain-containing protein